MAPKPQLQQLVVTGHEPARRGPLGKRKVQRIQLANQWFKQMSHQDPTVLLKLASAVSFLKRVTQAFAPAPGEVNAAGVNLTGFEHVEMLSNVEDRLRAGFTEREIEQIQLQESQLRANAAEKTRTA